MAVGFNLKARVLLLDINTTSRGWLEGGWLVKISMTHEMKMKMPLGLSGGICEYLSGIRNPYYERFMRRVMQFMICG